MTNAISDRALDLGVFALDNELESGRGPLGFGLPEDRRTFAQNVLGKPNYSE